MLDCPSCQVVLAPETLEHNLALLEFVIPGTTQMAHMIENSGAAQVRFSSIGLAELNAAVQVLGGRLPDQVLVFSGVEAPPK